MNRFLKNHKFDFITLFKFITVLTIYVSELCVIFLEPQKDSIQFGFAIKSPTNGTRFSQEDLS